MPGGIGTPLAPDTSLGYNRGVDIDHRARLTRQVERRQRLASAGTGAFLCAAGIETLALFWLAGARLFALWPEYPVAPLVLVAAAGAMVLGAAARAFCLRPTALAPARLIDRRTDGLDRSPGDYRSLVLDQAQTRAAGVRAADVLPFRWRTGLERIAALGMFLTLAALFLPRLDPFDFGRQRRQTATQRAHLEETRRATVERAQAIQQRPDETKRVEQAIASLEQTFQKAEPRLQQENQQRLDENRKELGELWRQASDAQLRSALQPARVEQAFGQGDAKETQRWKDALRHGDTAGLQKELRDLQNQIKDLAAKPDSAQKRAQRAQLQQKLGAMADAASKALQSPSLNAAMARAADQLAQGQNAQLSPEAMQAAADSLGLSEKELEALGQSMKNLQALDSALQAGQMAKQLNAKGELDGKAAGAGRSMADYAAAYAKMLDGQQGAGIGKPGPNRGLAAGGHVPQNGAASTDFHPEKSPTSLTGGKLLAQWQTSEVSEPGEVRRDDPGALQNNAQRVSEAIVQEQVPPGYHQAIQKYFDTVPAAAPGAGTGK